MAQTYTNSATTGQTIDWRPRGRSDSDSIPGGFSTIGNGNNTESVVERMNTPVSSSSRDFMRLGVTPSQP